MNTGYLEKEVSNWSQIKKNCCEVKTENNIICSARVTGSSRKKYIRDVQIRVTLQKNNDNKLYLNGKHSVQAS